jgi:hypothetical protein
MQITHERSSPRAENFWGSQMFDLNSPTLDELDAPELRKFSFQNLPPRFDSQAFIDNQNSFALDLLRQLNPRNVGG